MFRQALNTYWKSLHPRNLKDAKYKPDFFLLSIWIAQILTRPSESNLMEGYYMVTKFLPFFFMVWSNMASKLAMPKAMFFTPMKLEERRKYINSLMMIKIVVPVFLSMLLHLILFILMQEFRWFECVTCAFAVFTFGIGMYVCSELTGKYDRYIRYAVVGKNGIATDAWLNWVCMVASVGFTLGFSITETGGMSDADWTMMIVMLCILACISFIIIKTTYRSTIENVCDYENAFAILGRVKNG